MAEEALAKIGDEMLSLLAKGSITSMLNEVISLGEVPAALVRLSERHVNGEIVAKVK